ncbi:VCBS repeat-containing protein [Chloroflexi bacterium TSY]|nr:VCBS repeat-containing protein [Chloroflexi bacterium TSY]
MNYPDQQYLIARASAYPWRRCAKTLTAHLRKLCNRSMNGQSLFSPVVKYCMSRSMNGRTFSSDERTRIAIALLLVTTSLLWMTAPTSAAETIRSLFQGPPNNDLAPTLNPDPFWISNDVAQATSVAWGDVDGDGDLDLAVGNSGAPNKLYLNKDGVLTTAAVWNSNSDANTRSVAWADIDGDGDLDLAVGNHSSLFGVDTSGLNKLYLNEGGMLATTAAWISESDDTTSVAWGDVDGDGDLDLAVGNGHEDIIFGPGGGSPNKLYLNEDGMLTTTATWISEDADDTKSVAWGDVDGDGDLDLAVGNSGDEQNPQASGTSDKLYLNEGGRSPQLRLGLPTIRI